VDTLDEVCVLWLGVGELVQLLHYVGDSATEALIYATLRTFDVRTVGSLVTLTLEDNLATVLVSINDLTPSTDCIGVLLGSVNLNLYG
jgi:hypothetical protein